MAPTVTQNTVANQSGPPPRKRTNTTTMPFWPQGGDRDAPIPNYFAVDDEEFPGLSEGEQNDILQPGGVAVTDEAEIGRREDELEAVIDAARAAWEDPEAIYQRREAKSNTRLTNWQNPVPCIPLTRMTKDGTVSTR
jgi:hypothetical protein